MTIFMIFCFLFSVIVIIGGEKEVRAMMLIAHSKKMTLSGEYAFIYTELIEGEGSETFLLIIFSAIIYFSFSYWKHVLVWRVRYCDIIFVLLYKKILIKC